MKVKGTGPAPAEICLIGPYVGVWEDRTGLPFQGKAGEELDRYLNGIDLPERDDIYLTNLHKFYHGRDYVYTHEDVEKALPELQEELQRVRPKIIVTMGREVTRLFMGDVDITDVEGIPWLLPDECTIYPCPPTDCTVFPMIHIAAGLRNPELSPYVVAGFSEFSRYLEGELPARRMFDDPFPNPNYREITSRADLRASLKGVNRLNLSVDTEGWPHNPWSLQYSFIPGTGYLIRKTRPELLAAFADMVSSAGVTLVFHSALHERAMFRAMGLGKLNNLPFEDTMVAAYLLQLVPQGLKPGCLRYANMRMRDYSEVVGDVSNELARDYLTWIWDLEETEYDARCQQEFIRLTTTPYTDARGRTKPGRRLRALPKLPRTALHKAVARVLQSKRPRELWGDQLVDLQVAAYRRMGSMPEPTLDYVDPRIAIPYGCRDADGTGRLLPEYQHRLARLGLQDVYALELSTYPLIDRMQQIGVKPDLDHFAEFSGVLLGECERLQRELETLTERPGFNANSGDQVAAYLFDTLGLEEVKMTSSGRGSTNDKILEALEHEHPEYPVISTIREYRETYKLKNTFVDRLPDFVHRWPFDGRVHATFRTTRVITGRLAASDPNMLAQPEHGKWAKLFKQGWVAEDGHVLCAWDESQIELRVLAHLSRDPFLSKAFRKGIDLHAALAERIFGIKPKDQDKHKHRYPAKTIHYLMCMGGTAHGLMIQLRANGMEVDENTAQRWMDETFGLYTQVPVYMNHKIAEARRNGYIRCLSGRIRYIGGIRSRDDRTRSEAERFALSTPIQEGAQWQMKQVENTVWTEVLPYFWKRGIWCEPLLQVHDALKMEIEEGYQHELNELMVDAMTNTPNPISIPLAVEGEFGPNMADMEEFDAS